MASTTIDDAAVREKAYLLWEEDGKPFGRDTEYWSRALVALTSKSTMDSLSEPAPKKAKAAPAKVKAAASKAKTAPSKSQPAKKTKKK